MATQISRMPDRRAVPANDPRAALLQDLLCGFHIMDMSGQPSGMGSHFTARLPGANTFFFHIHNYGFGEVTPDHIHEADFELNVLSGQGIDINPTLHIHSRIYLARPDVNAIIHTHARHVSALSAIGANLETVSQPGARYYGGCILYDEDNGVAIGKDPGTAMARALGPEGCAMVLKNHGLLAVGRSIPEAVALAITMEEQAEIQLMAMAAGTLSLASHEDNLRTRDYLRSETMIGRAWAWYMRKLADERPHVMRM